MSGRVTRQRQRDGATKIPLLSPLKPAARGKRHSNNDAGNGNGNENASTSNKRPRSPSHDDPDAAQHDAKRVKQQPTQPLSPKNENGAAVPAIELGADAMAVDPKPQPQSQSQLLQPPKTPGRLFVSGSPQRTLVRTPGTVSRLPRPLFKSSAAPSLTKTPRGLFQATLGTTPARPKGPLTRGANIRRYKQPVPAKKPEPKVDVGSPRKATGIFARRVEGELGVPEETARETKASLSRLDEALKKLAAPRPPPRRPASSVGFASSSSSTMAGSSDGPSSSTAASSSSKPDSLPARPGTSLGFTSPSKLPLPSSSSRRLETIPGSPTRPQLGPPRLPTFAPHSPNRSVSASATVGDERRASAAIRGLNRTLSELVPTTTSHDLAADTLSGIRSKKEGSSSAERPKLRVQPPRAPSTRVAAQREAHADPKPAKPKEKDTAPHLDVLKNCTVFVDVRTDEGDDAAALFVDMLRGLGARILTRMSTRLTHIVFKSGLPGTIARYRMLNEPRPLVVGIGWVVECVEKRARVDEDRFAVDLDTAETKKRRAGTAPLNPVRTRTLRDEDAGADGDGEMSLTAAEESFLEFSFEKSILGVGVPPSTGKQKEIRDFFTPVERGGKRAFRPRVGSPLRETFALPDDDDEDEEDGAAEKVKGSEVELVQS